MSRLLGTSLIELMIASALSSCLVLALWQGLATHQHIYQSVSKQLSGDIELSLVSSMLIDRIHHAGFTPCMPLSRLVRSSETLFPYQLDNAGQRLTLNRMAGSYQEVRVMSDRELNVIPYPTSRGLSTGSKNLATKLDLADKPQSEGILQGGEQLPYLISNCSHAELVSVSHHTGNQITLQQPLKFVYEPPVFLGAWLSESFEVIKGKGMMLHAAHSDVLSQAVQKFNVQLEEEKHLFRLSLGVNDSHSLYRVVAAMRMY